MRFLNFIDLFAGIGGIRLAFAKYFGKCVFSCEIDKHAQETYKNNFGYYPYADITKLNVASIPNFDVLLAGFPCQAFSQAGLRKGFEDIRGTLFFDIARIIKHHNPKVIFLENVKGLKTHNKGNTFSTIITTLQSLGYNVHYAVLNAKDFGLPQNRQRIYIVCFKDNVNFTFPAGAKTPTKVADILENNVDEKYTISNKLWQGHQRRKLHNQQNGKGFGYSLFTADSSYTNTISARYYKDGSEALIQQLNKNPRKLTPKEIARLQGFPENFKLCSSQQQAYKQLGNSVAINVVESIAKNISIALKNYNLNNNLDLFTNENTKTKNLIKTQYIL